MKKEKVLKRINIICGVFIVALLCTSCGGEEKIQPKLPVGDKIENIPSYVMVGFKMEATEGAKKKWEFEAKTAQVLEMKKKSYAQSVRIKYFQPDGKFSYLTGDRAILSTDTNFMEITGNVELTGADGVRMQTQKLFWDDKIKKLYTDAAVTIIRKNSTLSGVGFESDISMKNMIIKKGVKLRAEQLGTE